jgi:hypothetical protein
MQGNALTANHTTSPNMFQDFYAPHGQPPLETSAATMGSCAIPHAVGSAPIIQGNATLGPYLYYSYHTTSGGKPVPDGAQIQISGTATFSQSNGAGCPTAANVPAVTGVGAVVPTAGTQSSATFPTYVFVGGLNNNGGTMVLAGGQYVMAGTTGANVFSQGGTLDGNTQPSASSTGTMFILTDAAYPTMNLPASFNSLVTGNSISNGGTALNQGTIDFSNNITSEIYGAVNSTNGSGMPATMNAYTGVAMWQDRRNSNVGYDMPAATPGCPLCDGDNGSVLYCLTNGDCPNPSTSSMTTLKNANHVTADSPGIFWTNGNTKVAFHGAIYQPRGAWMDFGDGNTGIGCGTKGCPLQVITGAVLMGNGNTRMELAGPTNPIIKYKAVLIQ